MVRAWDAYAMVLKGHHFLGVDVELVFVGSSEEAFEFVNVALGFDELLLSPLVEAVLALDVRFEAFNVGEEGILLFHDSLKVSLDSKVGVLELHFLGSELLDFSFHLVDSIKIRDGKLTGQR